MAKTAKPAKRPPATCSPASQPRAAPNPPPPSRRRRPSGSSAEAAYTAKDIEVLEGLEPVRRRPGHVYRRHRRKGAASSVRRSDRQLDGRGAGRPRDLHRGRTRAPTASCRSPTTAAASRSTRIRNIRRSRRSKSSCARCMPAANSTPKSMRPRAACTASASRWSTRCPNRLEVEVAREPEALQQMAFERGIPQGEAGKARQGQQPPRHQACASSPTPRSSAPRPRSSRSACSRWRAPRPICSAASKIRWKCAPELLRGIDDVPDEGDIPLRRTASRTSWPPRSMATRWCIRTSSPARSGKLGTHGALRMGGGLDGGRRRLPVLLLQHRADARRRHP